MTFSDFLTFIFSHWVEFWDFITNWYNEARNAALHVWDWLWYIYGEAVEYVDNATASLRLYADALIDSVKLRLSQVESLLGGLSLVSVLNWVIEQFNLTMGKIDNAASVVKAWALAKVNEADSKIRAWASDLVGSAIAPFIPFLGVLKWLLASKATIVSWFSFFNPENLNRFSVLIGDGFTVITNIISNPKGFIIALIENDLLPLLAWLLALALSYDDSDIPLTWNAAEEGYQPGSGSIAITGNGSTLPARPLSNVWVSGYRFSSHHPGVDLGLAKGQPVYASHSGVVKVAGWSSVGYGNNVVISGSPWWSRYAHLESYAVKEGQHVDAGQLIGLGDSTGNSTGNHLHFEVKYKGRFVDPLTVIPAG